ncbi:hypothetical protein ABZV60_22090, partial [Streptomyces sp. NPDC004787]|uniref:hypothetical protein n=1 Tax=Streptomyces sp. NPDC004787 TaxID=3154291 RepID=UPI0033AFB077
IFMASSIRVSTIFDSGTPPLSALAARAGALADRARSASVRELAEAIRQADRLGGSADPSDPYAD